MILQFNNNEWLSAFLPLDLSSLSPQWYPVAYEQRDSNLRITRIGKVRIEGGP